MDIIFERRRKKKQRKIAYENQGYGGLGVSGAWGMVADGPGGGDENKVMGWDGMQEQQRPGLDWTVGWRWRPEEIISHFTFDV